MDLVYRPTKYRKLPPEIKKGFVPLLHKSYNKKRNRILQIWFLLNA